MVGFVRGSSEVRDTLNLNKHDSCCMLYLTRSNTFTSQTVTVNFRYKIEVIEIKKSFFCLELSVCTCPSIEPCAVVSLPVKPLEANLEILIQVVLLFTPLLSDVLVLIFECFENVTREEELNRQTEITPEQGFWNIILT